MTYLGILSKVEDTWTLSNGSDLNTSVTPFSLSTTNTTTPLNWTREIFILMGTINGLCAKTIPLEIFKILLIGVVDSGLA